MQIPEMRTFNFIFGSACSVTNFHRFRIEFFDELKKVSNDYRRFCPLQTPPQKKKGLVMYCKAINSDI